MIENLAVVWALAGFATAVAARPDRVALLQPVHHVEIVNVLLADVIAAEPDEIVPIAKLVFHFSELASVLGFEFSARMNPRRVAVPIGSHRHDVANLPVMQALDTLDVPGVMMTLQANADFQILLLGLLHCRKEPA